MARRCVHSGTSYTRKVCLTTEQLHEQEEILSMWGPDVPVVAPPTAARWFSIAVLGFVTFGVLVSYTHPAMPAIRREYPFGGLVEELGGYEQNKVCVPYSIA